MSSVVDLVQLYWREEKLGRFAMPFSNISKLNRGPIDSSKSHRTTMPNLLQRNFPWAFLYINDSGTGRGSCYTVSSCPSVSQVMPTKPNLLEVRHLTYFATLFLEPASCSPPSTSALARLSPRFVIDVGQLAFQSTILSPVPKPIASMSFRTSWMRHCMMQVALHAPRNADYDDDVALQPTTLDDDCRPCA